MGEVDGEAAGLGTTRRASPNSDSPDAVAPAGHMGDTLGKLFLGWYIHTRPRWVIPLTSTVLASQQSHLITLLGLRSLPHVANYSPIRIDGSRFLNLRLLVPKSRDIVSHAESINEGRPMPLRTRSCQRPSSLCVSLHAVSTLLDIHCQCGQSAVFGPVITSPISPTSSWETNPLTYAWIAIAISLTRR